MVVEVHNVRALVPYADGCKVFQVLLGVLFREDIKLPNAGAITSFILYA